MDVIPDITQSAFRAFGDWTFRFGGKLNEVAVELAASEDGRNLITDDLLQRAALKACGELAAEIAAKRPPDSQTDDGSKAA